MTTPPEYVLARSVLLDALEALGTHLDAVILVGAQAIYLHTGDADLNVPPTTTDADLALAPANCVTRRCSKTRCGQPASPLPRIREPGAAGWALRSTSWSRKR